MRLKSLSASLAKQREKERAQSKVSSAIAKARGQKLHHSVIDGAVLTDSALCTLAGVLSKQPFFAYDTETVSLEDKTMYGASFCWLEEGKPSAPVYVVLNMPNTLEFSGVNLKSFQKYLQPVFENPAIMKIGHNLKFDINVLRTAGIRVQGELFDTLLASWMCDENTPHGLKWLATKHLSESRVSIKEAWMGQSVESQIQYARNDAIDTLRLYMLYEKKLQEDPKVYNVARKLEFPFIYVLADMEWEGIELDTKFLRGIHRKIIKGIEELKYAIFRETGEFNLDSSTQLGEILFDRLKLPVVKRSKKTQKPSADAEVLEELAREVPIVSKILEYRSLSKLASTYTSSLVGRVDSEGRVHGSFNQTGTVTGRLSSSDPNLQNIPKHKDTFGIRKAFVAKEGYTFVVADYSQVELRVMAHFSKDPGMMKAFADGEDIHTRTAVEIFKCAWDDAKPQGYRQIAKSINFGLIYGQSYMGLAHNVGISEEEAAHFIQMYFERYHDIDKYIQGLRNYCRDTGYVRQLLGRKRNLPNINSRDYKLRGAAERQAVNSKIQGSASDIMKVFMLKMWRYIQSENLPWKMLIQVHDEIIIEVPETDADTAAEKTKELMESAVKLRVPLVADVGVKKRWGGDIDG